MKSSARADAVELQEHRRRLTEVGRLDQGAGRVGALSDHEVEDLAALDGVAGDAVVGSFEVETHESS